MSYCRKEGKDEIIFLTKDDSSEPSKVNLDYDKEDEEEMGLIRPDGEINWNCPCLQGMADGPCGEEFKQSFSCFHYSEADPKGSDCIPQFRDMQECFVKYPEVYGVDDNVKKDESEIDNKTVDVDSQDADSKHADSKDTESKEEISAFSETVKEDVVKADNS
eukprot:gene6290-7012_t